MLTDFFEPFTLLQRSQSPDGQGGTSEAWRDFASFSGAITHVPGNEVNIAGLQALRTVPVLVHEFDLTLRQGDRVQRNADGATFRVAGCSNDMRTPPPATLQYAQVPVERLVTAP